MKRQRFFALFELLIAILLAAQCLVSAACTWRYAIRTRQSERRIEQMLALFRLKRRLIALLDAVYAPRAGPESSHRFFGTSGENELFFIYKPPLDEIEQLGSIAKAQLFVDRSGNLQLVSQSIPLGKQFTNRAMTQILISDVECLAFTFALTSDRQALAQSVWTDRKDLPQILRIEITFFDGRRWEIPHFFAQQIF